MTPFTLKGALQVYWEGLGVLHYLGAESTHVTCRGGETPSAKTWGPMFNLLRLPTLYALYVLKGHTPPTMG